MTRNRPREDDLRVWHRLPSGEVDFTYPKSLEHAKTLAQGIVAEEWDSIPVGDRDAYALSKVRDNVGLEIYQHSDFDEPYEWCEWFDVDGNDIHATKTIESTGDFVERVRRRIDFDRRVDAVFTSGLIALLAFGVMAIGIKSASNWLASDHSAPINLPSFIQRP